MHRIALATIAATTALTGCVEYGQNDEVSGASVWDTGWWDDGQAESTDEPADDDHDGLAIEPAWWTISGSVELEDGAASKSGTNFTLHFSGSDGGPPVEICTVTPTVLALTPAEPTDPDVVFSAWWEVELELPLADDCSPSGFLGGGTTLRTQLGIGEISPLLGPAMDTAGYPWDPWSSVLKGLYLQVDPAGPLYVFGIAGTEQQYTDPVVAMENGDVDESHLADGVYTLTPLHLIAL